MSAAPSRRTRANASRYELLAPPVATVFASPLGDIRPMLWRISVSAWTFFMLM
jgi:hypothetical protein